MVSSINNAVEGVALYILKRNANQAINLHIHGKYAEAQKSFEFVMLEVCKAETFIDEHVDIVMMMMVDYRLSGIVERWVIEMLLALPVAERQDGFETYFSAIDA